MASGRYPNLETGTPTSPTYSDLDEDRPEAPIRNTVPSSSAHPTLVNVARYHSPTSPRYTPTSPGYSDDEDRSASPRSSADVQSIQKMKAFRIDKDEYVINHFLGKGEYGVVFSVSNKNQEMFAAKFLKALQPASKIAPGEIELKVYDLLRQLPHPQLLQLVSTGDLLSTPAGFSTRVILTRVLGLSIWDTLNKAKEQDIQARARNGSTSSMTVPRVAFPLQSIKMMCQKIINGMDHLENLKVYHLDLKTANIYFTENEDFQLDFSDNSHSLIQLSDVTIQIGDFGVCRFHEVDGAATVPRIVQTQFYRAPEILLGLPYNTKADVWSFGAVAAELYTGDFLFPGAVGPDSEVSQFQKILTVTSARMPREMMKKREKYGSSRIGGNIHSYLKRSASSSSSTQGLLQLKRSDEAKAFFSMLTSVLILNPDSRPSFKKIKKNKFLV
ncbi:hypothetical protein CRE_08525 [Caenorhabditis remanei]|uniref:Uncharacterized protein n=1 Tax=Caenorhabditis remanei TaxID=31234 RepID=E3N6X6_CAERE|nr:hypothetical protein CRE_08525 [Caenorhabditis remanei]